jgi:hypothetical protein
MARTETQNQAERFAGNMLAEAAWYDAIDAMVHMVQAGTAPHDAVASAVAVLATAGNTKALDGLFYRLSDSRHYDE